ncbi:hypothetical protein SAMN05660485_03339 [Blastococcus fimeti]|nr:hypothetical protein SAMN05660485_03339 [Blastococcus fimeti]
MYSGRSRRSLQERAAESGVSPGPPAGSAPGHEVLHTARAEGSGSSADAAAGAGGEGRHCWVRDPPEFPGTWPGLLVEWRQRGGAWQGRVAYTVAGPDGPALIETWLPAARLEPR